MKRERLYDELDRAEQRPRPRAARVALREAEADEPAGPAEPSTKFDVQPAGLAEALLVLCQRFGLESWAAEHDDRGVWAFGCALAQWLSRLPAERTPQAAAETVRLVTNLLIVAGAVTRPPQQATPGAAVQATGAVAAARQAIASYHGPVASFPAAARAMQRLVRVRGWSRLNYSQQILAEALLGLYLESLATLDAAPCAGVLLALTEAWLSVLHTLALPSGFDERILRATSWYLETYLSSAGSGQ